MDIEDGSHVHPDYSIESSVEIREFVRRLWIRYKRNLLTTHGVGSGAQGNR